MRAVPSYWVGVESIPGLLIPVDNDAAPTPAYRAKAARAPRFRTASALCKVGKLPRLAASDDTRKELRRNLGLAGRRADSPKISHKAIPVRDQVKAAPHELLVFGRLEVRREMSPVYDEFAAV